MVNIPDFSIDPERERREMENQARQAIQDLNDFILGSSSAHTTRIFLAVFFSALKRYERDCETPAGTPTAEEKLMEKLAERAHDSWSHWMQYLFSRSCKQADGSVIIPAELVERWKRQMHTPYSQLSEQEKLSDREQAETIFQIIHCAMDR